MERALALRTGGYVIDFWGLGYDIAERGERFDFATHSLDAIV